MERIDCHCHIFNMVTIGWRIILQQLSDAVSPRERAITTRGIADKAGKIAEIVKAFTKDSPHIFEMLDDKYAQEYKLFALMFDGDFLLKPSVKKQVRDISRQIRNSFEVANEQPEGERGTRSVTSEQIPAENPDLQTLLDFLDEMSGERETRGLRSIRKDGFTVQVEAIKEMSAREEYKERLVPFLGVDPRRKNILSYLPEVGKGQVFAGIKVYPPNGFSPYDPVLVGPGSVFEYCSKQGIPVVSHCSYGGFATPVKSVKINGLIMPKRKKEPIAYHKTYPFKKGLKDGFGVMVKERAHVLNHPKIWARVLDIYENLILVLAHFGVGSEEWQDEIVRMLYRYKNLYTDISCMSEDAELERIKAIYLDHPEIQHKILYGSDFYLNLFYNDSFRQYKERMERVFGEEIFDKLTIDNPAGFVAGWY